MSPTFNIGDKVTPIKNHGPLMMGEVYTILWIEESPYLNARPLLELVGSDFKWYVHRFRHAQKSILEDEEYKRLFI